MGYRIRSNQTRRALLSYEWFRKTWLTKSGWMAGVGSYRLDSFDGGRHWYAVELSSDNGSKILGPAEEKFPGLMARLQGMDRLSDYVRRNGPLTLKGDNAALEQHLLQGAGFTVQHGCGQLQ
jgi:hypothetical protein